MSDEATSRSVMRRVTAMRSPKVLYDDMVAMLRRLEWDGGTCRVCLAAKWAGAEDHEPTCDLAAILRDLP